MIQEIVPPEPPGKMNLANAWQFIPRRGRIVLFLVVVAAAILAAFLMF
jgi:hypothetical protein